MGTIFKRSDTWYISYQLNGKRYRKAIGKSKEIASLALKDIEVRIAKQRAGFPVQCKTVVWRDKFIQYIEAHLKPSTVLRYKEALAWFFAFLDRLPRFPIHLTDITTEMLEEFKVERLKKVKRKTVNNDLSTIRRFLNLAISRGYLIQNPMDRVEFLHLSDRKLPRFLTKNELSQIYENMTTEDADILRILPNTGMRWGELRHLEWRDINIEGRLLRISPKKDWSPKGGVERKIPMNDVVFSILAGRERTNGYVFTTGRDNMLHRDHLREKLQKICGRLGIWNVNLHTLRHTCASHLVMAGVDLPTIAEILGHTDIKTTMIYSHLAGDQY